MDGRVWWWERTTGLAVAGLVALIYLGGGWERLELITYDWRMRWSAGPPGDQTVIVAIDNPSLKELATWPWPRALHARLIQTLTEAGANVIAFDVDFSTARDDRDDALLARAASQSGRVILAAFRETRALDDGTVVEYANLPYPELRSAAHAVGSINLPVDVDGGLRRVPLRADLLGDLGFSFAVAIVRMFRGENPVIASVPLSGEETSYIRFFGGPSTFRTVSYADVLHARIDPALFRDKMVLVGATSLELQDFRQTPFTGLMAGVEIQANAVETLLNGAGYRRTTATQVLLGIATAAGGWSLLLVVLGITRQRDHGYRLRVIGILGTVLLLGIGGLAWFAFDRMLFLDLIPLAATGGGQVATSFIAGYWTAERRVEFQSENLTALYQMGEATRHQTTLERMTDLLFTQTHHLLNVDLLGLDVWDETARHFTARLLKDGTGFRPPLPLGGYEDVLTRVLQATVPISIPDMDGRVRLQGYAGFRIGSTLLLPMVAQNRVIGVLHVHRMHPTRFQEDEAKTLLTLATQVALNIENGHLLEEVRMLFQRSLEAFSTALDFKDNDTGGHSQRVAVYAIEVARRMGVAADHLEVIGQGALLHDIGKIAVPDRILLKAGKLSDEEWVVMRKHPETGYSMLKTIQIPEPIATIVRHHHERFDGQGYPAGLRGAQIALGARIFSVADLYDAMTNDRPYRKALSMDHVVAELKRIAGTQVDPEVVDAFLAIPAEMLTRLRAGVHEGRQAA